MKHDELMEEKVAFYMRDILGALQYLHGCRVAHLDLKVSRLFFPGPRSLPALPGGKRLRKVHFSLCQPFFCHSFFPAA